MSSEASMQRPQATVQTGEGRKRFPCKLMQILNDDDYPDIVAWLPHGRGFTIADKKRFAEEVLPRYFKKSKFPSFNRKLNRWKFTIQMEGRKKASYYHPFFLRDNQELCLQMFPMPQNAEAESEHERQLTSVGMTESMILTSSSLPCGTNPAFSQMMNRSSVMQESSSSTSERVRRRSETMPSITSMLQDDSDLDVYDQEELSLLHLRQRLRRSLAGNNQSNQVALYASMSIEELEIQRLSLESDQIEMSISLKDVRKRLGLENGGVTSHEFITPPLPPLRTHGMMANLKNPSSNSSPNSSQHSTPTKGKQERRPSFGGARAA